MGDKGKKGVGCIINPKNWDWIDEELKDTDTLTIWISKTPNGVRTDFNPILVLFRYPIIVENDCTIT